MGRTVQDQRMRKKRNTKFTLKMQKKLVVLFLFVLLAFVGLSARLVLINKDNGEQYKKQVLSQQTYDSKTIPFRRGDILDSNGMKLAVCEKVYNVILDARVMLKANNGECVEPTIAAAQSLLGLDGLASSVTVMIATFFTAVAVGTASGLEPVTCAVVGALLGFLLFNVYPARVFMGDTGSLALGGFVAAAAYMLQMPLFIPIVALVYAVEVISVMIQVSYFKASGGKRFFKMAPIHHHFELCGWSETRVVAVFTIVTALLCLVALLGV